MSLRMASSVSAQAAALLCPRCQQPLIDPHGLGWCKGCGFCRSLEESGKAGAQVPAAKSNPAAATGAVIKSSAWVWITLLGIMLIAGGTFLAGRYLTFTPFERALITSVAIALGLVVLFTGQFIVLVQIAPEDASLTFKDAIFPFRLYPLACKRLPRTCIAMFSGGWGLTAIITAVVFIGGLGHWLNYLPSNQKKHPNQVQKSNLTR